MHVKIKPFRIIFLFLLLHYSLSSKTQQPGVIDEPEYKEMVAADSMQKMVELKPVINGLVYDLRYATKNNFTGKKLYKKGNKTFLRVAAADALNKVQEELLQAGYKLKIWDAYRPYSVTKKMWELIQDERYVANPAKGSNHNRGLAVDLTLVDIKSGLELDMGTGYDNFTDTAHHSFKNLPGSILQNRQLLKAAMEKQGFLSLDSEWWHYSFPNNRNYSVLDLPLNKLK